MFSAGWKEAENPGVICLPELLQDFRWLTSAITLNSSSISMEIQFRLESANCTAYIQMELLRSEELVRYCSWFIHVQGRIPKMHPLESRISKGVSSGDWPEAEWTSPEWRKEYSGGWLYSDRWSHVGIWDQQTDGRSQLTNSSGF